MIITQFGKFRCMKFFQVQGLCDADDLKIPYKSPDSPKPKIRKMKIEDLIDNEFQYILIILFLYNIMLKKIIILEIN